MPVRPYGRHTHAPENEGQVVLDRIIEMIAMTANTVMVLQMRIDNERRLLRYRTDPRREKRKYDDHNFQRPVHRMIHLLDLCRAYHSFHDYPAPNECTSTTWLVHTRT